MSKRLPVRGDVHDVGRNSPQRPLVARQRHRLQIRSRFHGFQELRQSRARYFLRHRRPVERNGFFPAAGLQRKPNVLRLLRGGGAVRRTKAPVDSFSAELDRNRKII
jgi:hypothetical protein